MTKVNKRWQVQPHGRIEPVDEDLLSVTGEIPMAIGTLPRRMTILGLPHKRTAIWSPIALSEPDMRQIEALGEPAFLIVPGIAHRLDIKAWKTRYPLARVLCPPGARKAVEEVVGTVDATTDILDDPSVSFETLSGVGERESALVVRRRRGVTLVLNDIVANVRQPRGIGAKMYAKLLGYGIDRPRAPLPVRWSLIDDLDALATHLREWSSQERLKRIIVSHGDVIEDAPRATLEQVARELED